MLTETSTVERARALRKAGRPAEAVVLYQQAMAADPLNFALWAPCARAALAARDPATAASLLTVYTRMHPTDARSLVDLGFANFSLSRVDEARDAYERAVRIEPQNILALCAIGHLAYVTGDRDRARAYHDATLAVPAGKADEEFVHSGILMVRGDYEHGMQLYERRWAMEQYTIPAWRQGEVPLWTGEQVDGRTVFVHYEGGHGDSLMYARYLPLVAARGARVVLGVQPGLRRLLGNIPGVAHVATPDDPRDPDALHQSIWSLQAVFGTTIDTVPPVVTPTLPREPFALPPTTALRVGVVWAGEPSVTHDWDRSLPDVDLLRPLFEVAGVEWWSLQVGQRAADAARTPIRVPERLGDFADTAALIAELDLVIAVDTAVAHLAGTMGKPTWVMIPTVPEFRWLLEGEVSPWYPNVRLFRRRETGAWREVIDRVARELARVAAHRGHGG